MSKETGGLYEFGRYRLDADNRVLFRDGQAVALPPKAVELLRVLVEQCAQVVPKEQLMRRLWPDAFVEDSNLTQNIFLLRKVFGADEAGRKYIETVPRRGYRFVGEVKIIPPPGGLKKMEPSFGPTIIEKHTIARIITEEEAEQSLAEPAATLLPGIAARALLPGTIERKLARRSIMILAGLTLILAMAVLGYLLLPSRPRPAATEASKKAIAVLPFKPINSADRDEVLELGMADALITRLSNVSQVVVRPTSSVRKYAGAEQDASAAGRELGVESVLEGSIQRLDDRIRVTVQLVSVRDDVPLWSFQCDEHCTNLLDVQDALSEKVAAALALKLTGEERQRLMKRYTEDVEAYQLYLKGRYYWNKRTEQGFEQAIIYFNQAIDQDPNYALAYAGLADCYALLSVWGARPANDVLPKARQAAARATASDPALAEAHTSLAFAEWIYDRDWPGAEAEFRQAIQCNPRYPTAHHWYAYFLAAMQRFDEAFAQIKQARDLDETSPSINTDVAEIYCWARRYDQAAEQLQNVLKSEPNFAPARNVLGMTYIKLGRLREGVAELEMARRLDNSPRVMSALGCAYGIAGLHRQAQQITDELIARARQRHVSPFSRALIYTGLGERDEAFTWLERAFNEHSDSIVILKVYPWVDSLRSDPRFPDLLRRVGLEP